MPTWTDTHLGGAAFTHSAEEHPSRLVHHFPSSQQLPEHQALVAVIETGSFSEAARSLGVTKSCISKQIGRLEERLGVRLLQRTTRSIHPTEAGEGFYQRCLRILAELNAAEEMAAQLHNSPIGTLRISAPVMFGHRFLDPIVYAFLKLHPRLGADLVYTNTDVDIVGGASTSTSMSAICQTPPSSPDAS
jgi:DNA-binding transcriptional LysR family regulator